MKNTSYSFANNISGNSFVSKQMPNPEVSSPYNQDLKTAQFLPDSSKKDTGKKEASFDEVQFNSLQSMKNIVRSRQKHLGRSPLHQSSTKSSVNNIRSSPGRVLNNQSKSKSRK